MRQAMMLFDGDCGFCRRWIGKWRHITGDQVRYEPWQNELQNYKQLTQAACEKSVQLILSDGSVLSGAKAVFKALELGGKPGWLRAYHSIPLFAPLAEGIYRLIANNRMLFSKFI